MRSVGFSKYALAIVLIACLLRGLLPVESDLAGGAGRLDGGRASEESLEFPCAGHACGCRTAEHCLTACCCAPMPEGLEHAVIPARAETAGDLDGSTTTIDPRESPRSADVAIQRIARSGIGRAGHTAFFEALKCAGGSSRAAATASSILSIEPRSIAWSSIDDGARREACAAFEEIAGRRPSPSTPPPREATSCT